ncbi:hypothetical protein, partial [Klebsiella pneumoniae]|uniref:hypothetical protein n=1 Tax=Klebsiella pneumoniae TaxID=573 RepID=UPI00117BB6D4
MEERILPKNKHGDFAAGFNRISDVGWPLEGHDVITMEYLSSYLSRTYDSSTYLFGDFDFENKKLRHVGRPDLYHEAVPKIYMEENTLFKNQNGDYIANNNRIVN